MGQGYFTRAGRAAAAGQRHGGRRVVGTAEGTHIHQRVGGIRHARHGVDLRGLEGLGAGHIRQNRGQAAGQHGLARAGRADEQYVVAACGGDLQRTLHILLPHDIGKVRQGAIRRLRLPARRGGHRRVAVEVGDELGDALYPVDRQAVGQRGFRGVLGGDIQSPDAHTGGAQRHGQHTGDGAQRAGKAQLAQKGGVLRQGLQLLRCGQNTQQDGQIVQCALLPDPGRGQIHGDAADGEFCPAVFHGGPHPFAGLLDRRVRQAHHVKGGQTAGEKALHRHLVAADAGETQRTHSDHHGSFPPSKWSFSMYLIIKSGR